ncbi:peptidoglycan-binding domain-containing protein [Micromonospora sp. WMMD812]|uniref:peptidoglycan-binding domain-containing protein n=1 Tax=Micromonospora sp. WMMD812 TaxID=3015152 RepID=UPI00248C881C|nr:peptidoglycan-binding domain-containing protein [Micromonospora sp. WMMD812]WBB65943.1 peptidoglycan-binding domain-containing protein [Micromonospora sp. WMMD812]
MTARHIRPRTVALTAAVAVAAAAGVAAAVGFGGTDRGTAATGTTPPPATATIGRQTLTDAQTVDGELGYGTTRTATARLGGTITALPDTGTVVKRGGRLYAVDNDPVVLLYGSLPAYRVLEPGVEGADVAQFERNLRVLGHTGFTVDDEYTGSTADAVREWQEDLGLPETGRVEPGRIVYADDAVRVESHQASTGDATQPGQGVLAYTGTSRLVTVELDVDDQRLAKKGATVDVGLPDGDPVTGKVESVQTVIDPGSGGAAGQSDEAETKIEVTVSVTDPAKLTAYDQASVEVTFTATERPDVLTVPVAALLALAEGGYGVEVVDGGRSRIVAVTTGLFAAGRVEVSGPDVAEGLTVGMPA